ncbi:MAG: biotin synthase BioB [Chloroflexi bacterium]|nr:biotin synthase BioB [Chloroflexota bacterium]
MASTHWHALADQVLAGERATTRQAVEVLEAPDSELLDLLSAAFRVREAAFGRTVQLYVLMNVRSGLCPEDCGYCSQSRRSTAEIPKYPLVSDDDILDAAGHAARWGACTFCMVASGRGPSNRDVDRIGRVVGKVKEQFPLRVCACLGLLSADQALRLHQAGVDRVNHNLNTSERFYPEICSTHSYADRLETLMNVEAAGIGQCSGCIIGMGETAQDLAAVAERLGDLNVVSIPVNFLHPVDGTPLQGTWNLTPQYCLKALCMFRFVNPRTEIRMAGGRELHLGSLQPLGLYPANSLFLGDYLTTSGQAPERDLKMIAEMGFEVTSSGPSDRGPAPELRRDAAANLPVG